MKKSKGRVAPPDRLSELPDSLLHEIFWLLPMTDVVQTSILSKRWKNLWTTTPYLNFYNYTIRYRETDRFRDFVNGVLSRWVRGNRVLKFRVESLHPLRRSIYSEIDSWVRFATENAVEEFHLSLYYDSSTSDDGFDCREEIYWVPQCLYSCSSLKELSITYCNFEVNGNVQWNQLENLTIYGFGVTEHVVNQILCGSPKLEVFILSFAEKLQKLIIQSSSLKELSIDKYLYSECDVSVGTELRISTPNLETLEISGAPYAKCLLMDVKSLRCATIAFFHLQHFMGPKFLGEFSGDDYIGDALSNILPTIKHAEEVSLSGCCMKVLGDVKNKYMHSSFPNVKLLKLICCFEESERISDLEIFPQLKKLVLEDLVHRYENESPNFDAKSFYQKFETNLPKSFLLQLRTVKVTCLEGSYSMFPCIEILLKYASKLEKMVFKVIKEPPSPPSNYMYLAAQKLLRMPRSSPTAEVIICEH